MPEFSEEPEASSLAELVEDQVEEMAEVEDQQEEKDHIKVDLAALKTLFNE